MDIVCKRLQNGHVGWAFNPGTVIIIPINASERRLPLRWLCNDFEHNYWAPSRLLCHMVVGALLNFGVCQFWRKAISNRIVLYGFEHLLSWDHEQVLHTHNCIALYCLPPRVHSWSSQIFWASWTSLRTSSFKSQPKAVVGMCQAFSWPR